MLSRFKSNQGRNAFICLHEYNPSVNITFSGVWGLKFSITDDIYELKSFDFFHPIILWLDRFCLFLENVNAYSTRQFIRALNCGYELKLRLHVRQRILLPLPPYISTYLSMGTYVRTKIHLTRSSLFFLPPNQNDSIQLTFKWWTLWVHVIAMICVLAWWGP